MSEFKKEKLKLHQKPSLNSSGFYVQSVSSNLSDNMLFANAYGETKEEALKRGRFIACAPEMLEMIKRCEMWISNCSQHANIIKDLNELIKKATE